MGLLPIVSLAETVLVHKYKCIICVSHAMEKEGMYSEVQQFCPEDWTQQKLLLCECIVLLLSGCRCSQEVQFAPLASWVLLASCLRAGGRTRPED